MVTDEELEKLKTNAERAVNDTTKGLTIALAIDPVKMFAIASELLKLRRMQQVFEEMWEASSNDA